MDDNIYFKRLLAYHKILISKLQTFIDLNDEKSLGIIGSIDFTALKLCLYYANFKCQYPGCDKTDELSVHHLIKKDCKQFLDTSRYLSLRHYWNNQVILCKDHHDLVDNCIPKDGKKTSRDVLPKFKVDKIKKRFILEAAKEKAKYEK
jgi:5-methylcytosine-specific restriction endonuclease McrA